MAHITVSHVSKAFAGRVVLDDINLGIEAGEFVTLIGPSGCGKSTLLRIICGLEPASTGSIEINGRPVDHLRPAARNLAMVFQSYALYPHLTARANMAVPLTMRELSPLQRLPIIGHFMPGTLTTQRAIDARIDEVARVLGLTNVLAQKPGQMSGGQRQRVALGRAMVRQPAAFLMDEPLSNLDANMRAQMRSEISDLHRRLGSTFLYVTHDQTEAMTLSDRVVVMLDGRVQQIGSPREVYDDPDTLAVASFFGEPAINHLAAQVRSDGDIEVEGVVVTAPGLAPGASVTMAIRPERLSMRLGPPVGSTPYFGATVVRVEDFGADRVVHARTASGVGLVARLGAASVAVKPGDIVGLEPDLDALLLFNGSGERLRPTRAARPGWLRVCP